MVKIGICMSPPSETLGTRLGEAGCDYYEPGMARTVMADDAASFDAQLASWSSGGLEPRSANTFVPAELPVVGPAVDQSALRTYLKEALRRARALGLETIVFGSGGARRIPDGFDRAEATEQFAAALRMAAEEAYPDVTIAAEHLRKAETNLMNSLAEAAELVASVGAANLALVVDIYHLNEEHEDVGVVRDAAPYIRHVHVCGSSRQAPTDDDIDMLAPLFRALADISYDRRCSIECGWKDLAVQGAPALAAVRTAARQAGLV